MPRRDSTGPLGQGPMTGRGLGPCGGGRAAGLGRGLGLGLGLGLGWGWRRGARRFAGPVPTTPADEAAALKERADILEAQLSAVKQRITRLETGQE